MTEATLKRAQILPLCEPADIYAVLSRLSIGDTIPPHVLIVDYTNGAIPPWTITEIEEAGDLRILTVIDPTAKRQATLFESACVVGKDVFTMPTKTLAGPFYGYHVGCEHARNMLADIRQHARQIVDRKQKKATKNAA